MAGTIPLSLTQRLDKTTLQPLAGGKLYFIRAGTTSTPQSAFQDSALTIEWPNPLTLDAGGNIPQLFFADGSIKIRLTNAAGVTQLSADNILVVGASSGGGGGSSVDTTTVLTTGDIKVRYGTGTHDGFVRANGRTIGSASSGATERANADCQALFEFLWGFPGLTILPSAGVSAAADWAANKTIVLPDWRGRAIAGLDDMGNAAASRLTTTYFGSDATVLGVAGGLERSPGLSTANLPPYTPVGTIAVTAAGTISSVSPAGWSVSVTSTISNILRSSTHDNYTSVAGDAGFIQNVTNGSVTSTGGAGSITGSAITPVFTNNGSFGTFTGTAQGGVSAPFATVAPMLLATIYIKL